MMKSTVNEILDELKLLVTADHYAKLSHFGINATKAYGVKIPLLRQFAKKIGKNHELALALWDTDVHEARLLASMIELPELITDNQFDSWVNDFDSWDMCDQCCGLLGDSPLALQKVDDYSVRTEEFVKRTAFVLMCQYAVHHKKMEDDQFCYFLKIIEREAWDERNFVRKAVNWALRQIGKRNEFLRLKAIESAEAILNQNSKSARWIATDALRELRSQKVIDYIEKHRK
ncbi:DNA alkylation repair protein [Paludibacter propionicigenes]|nr:DNA alkylation repair protein [Paludibacter propionicigenes]